MIKLSKSFTFENLVVLADLLRELLQQDILILISDLEKIVKCIQGDKIQLPIKEGDKLREQWSLTECIQTKELVNIVVSKEVLGISYRAIASPIYARDGKIIGAFSIIKNNEIEDELINSAENLTKALKQISQNAGQMAANAEILVNSHGKMYDSSKDATINMRETDKILNFINIIAGKSNILGINASIEAARAGESAQGFNVVATAIRELSENSNTSVTKAKDILEKVKNSVNIVTSEIEINNTIIENQASFIEELNATIEELTAVAEKLYSLSKDA